jgi:hypothetical protein
VTTMLQYLIRLPQSDDRPVRVSNLLSTRVPSIGRGVGAINWRDVTTKRAGDRGMRRR